MDGPRDCHTEWSKSDRERQISCFYVGSKKKSYKWTYLQNRNRVTYVENRLMVTSGKDGERHKLGYWEYPTLLAIYTLSSVQSLIHVQLFATPWITAWQASLSITNSWSLLKFMSTESVMPSSQSHPLSSPSPPAPNPSQHHGLFPMSQLFTWGGQSTGVSASASVLPMNTQDWSP